MLTALLSKGASGAAQVTFLLSYRMYEVALLCLTSLTIIQCFLFVDYLIVSTSGGSKVKGLLTRLTS